MGTLSGLEGAKGMAIDALSRMPMSSLVDREADSPSTAEVEREVWWCARGRSDVKMEVGWLDDTGEEMLTIGQRLRKKPDIPLSLVFGRRGCLIRALEGFVGRADVSVPASFRPPIALGLR